ncbi:hypothetical protein KCU65_g9380, partial [Aureobasidium melanogenum]
MATPTLDQFLSEINRITLSKDSSQLSQYLVIEPPYAPSYNTIINELRKVFPKGSNDSDTALEKKINKAVKVIDGGDDVEVASWSAFSRFMVLYFGFLRDVDVGNLLETFGLLSEVLQKANSALQNQTHGTTILDTVISYSRMFARLAMGLDKKPELIAHLTTTSSSGGDDSGPRETLPERAANIIRYIAKGDIVGFRRHLDIGSEHYAWFSGYRLDLQLRNRCEVFVWRSICRKTFILHGDPGNPEARKAPTFDLKDVLAIFRWQETVYATLPGASQPDNYIDPDFVGVVDEPTGEDTLDLPDMNNIHSKMTALIHQGLLGGYISFARDKFAIQGAKLKGALAAGFPNAWKTIEARADDEVPGWKLEFSGPAFGGGVVRLSGARPVGLS